MPLALSPAGPCYPTCNGGSWVSDTSGSWSREPSSALMFCGLGSCHLFLLHHNSGFWNHWNPCYLHHAAGWDLSDRLSSSQASLPWEHEFFFFLPANPTVLCPPPPPLQPPTALPVDAVAWRPAYDGQLRGKRWLNNLSCHLKAAIVIVMWQVVTVETATHSEWDSL